MTSSNQGLGANNQQLAGIITMDKTTVGGGEISFDAAGQFPIGAGAAHATFNETLNESGCYPTFRFNTGANPVFAIDIIKPSYSDPLGGAAVPMIDLTTAGNISAFRVIDPSASTARNHFSVESCVGGRSRYVGVASVAEAPGGWRGGAPASYLSKATRKKQPTHRANIHRPPAKPQGSLFIVSHK